MVPVYAVIINVVVARSAQRLSTLAQMGDETSRAGKLDTASLFSAAGRYFHRVLVRSKMDMRLTRGTNYPDLGSGHPVQLRRARLFITSVLIPVRQLTGFQNGKVRRFLARPALRF